MKYLSIKHLLALAFLLLIACGEDEAGASNPNAAAGSGCDLKLSIAGIDSHTCSAGAEVSEQVCGLTALFLEDAEATYVDACPAGQVLECEEEGTTTFYYNKELAGSTCEELAEEDVDSEDSENTEEVDINLEELFNTLGE